MGRQKSLHGYYQLEDKRIIRVIYDHFGVDRVLCRKENGVKCEITRAAILQGTPIKYVRSHAQLWELSKRVPRKRFTKAELKKYGKNFQAELHLTQRIEFFLNKLIELDHVTIDTLGYYYKNPSDNKETIGEDLARGFARWLYILVSNSKQKRDEFSKTHTLWNKWIQNPTKENADNFFRLSREAIIERECPITGERFQWFFDGSTFQPTYRVKTLREKEATGRAITREYKALQKRKRLTSEEAERLAFLQKVFKDDYSWFGYFDLFNLETVKPFSDVYADQKTGKFPKVVVEIEVPTGKLTFANSLYDYVKDFPKSEEHSRENSVCHLQGRKNTSEFHARVNQTFFVQVGNTSPHIFQSKKTPNRLRVGRPVEENPSKHEWSYQAAKRNWVDRGRICTGLWAFMATDRSNLPKEIEVDHFTVTVAPGRYRLINHYEDEGYESGIYCEISRI